MRGVFKIAVLAVSTLASVRAKDDPVPAHYYWKSSPAGESSQFLTLFCRSCEDASRSGRDIPLVAVLRDTLGDTRLENDRISYVWLLTYSRPTLEKRALSAVPFFYWKLGSGSAKVSKNDLKPIINLATPQRSVVSSSMGTVIQFAVLDPISSPVRASTRAYQTNRLDHERLHIEEAKSYLQSAPAADDESGLNEKELNTVIARLELRKSRLGDFVTGQRAEERGESANLDQERIRSRNWDLLRQCADKTGLFFEPVDLAGAKSQYAVLWYEIGVGAPPAGPPLERIWKLLNLKNPYEDRLELEKATRYRRTWNGREVEVVPLGIYSLTYPKLPLLMIDFRGSGHLRRHELTQRAITELTSGVIGISRFANWYYYAGAMAYDFYATRRGTAMDQRERLTSYSQFRVALALDKTLDPELRAAMQHRVDSLAVNPLETSPKREMEAALKRYDLLEAAVANDNGAIASRLEKDRRRELARYEESQSRDVRNDVFHYLSFGMYTHRSRDVDFLDALDKYRQAEAYLDFLDGLAAAGTAPEVAYDSSRIRDAVVRLKALLPELKSRDTQVHAERTLARLGGLSGDLDLRAECAAALDSMGSSTSGALKGSGQTETLR